MLNRKPLWLFLLLGISACKPNTDERARDVILHYCDIHYKQYQPVNFGPVHAYYVPYERSDYAKDYLKTRKNLKHSQDSIRKLIVVTNKAVYLLQADSVRHILDTLDKAQALYKQRYKPVRKGWMMRHQYKRKSVNAPLIHATTAFILDNDLKNILETYDE